MTSAHLIELEQTYARSLPLENLRALMGPVHYEEWLGGTLYIAWGRKS